MQVVNWNRVSKETLTNYVEIVGNDIVVMCNSVVIITNYVEIDTKYVEIIIIMLLLTQECL